MCTLCFDSSGIVADKLSERMIQLYHILHEAKASLHNSKSFSKCTLYQYSVNFNFKKHSRVDISLETANMVPVQVEG